MAPEQFQAPSALTSHCKCMTSLCRAELKGMALQFITANAHNVAQHYTHSLDSLSALFKHSEQAEMPQHTAHMCCAALHAIVQTGMP
jgi:hypothetical protein